MSRHTLRKFHIQIILLILCAHNTKLRRLGASKQEKRKENKTLVLYIGVVQRRKG